MQHGSVKRQTQLAEAESDLSDLQRRLQPINASVNDLFACMRNKYLRRELKGSNAVFVGKVLGAGAMQLTRCNLSPAKKKRLDAFIKRNRYNWGKADFHLRYRAKTALDLHSAFHINGELEKIVKKGYCLSVMPLNIAISNSEMLNKFIPKKDFFAAHHAKRSDPYGIFSKKSKLYWGKTYLASQKFSACVLMNITSSCPMGCVGCYKGEFTRIAGRRFCTNLAKAAGEQSRLLVKHLNRHSGIKSVVISGGEPLLMPNNGIEKMLAHFRKARHLAELRFCTGVIFQGLPFRIDDQLLGILERFEADTGIKVNFNAHLSHPTQFSPEALIAVKKIIKKGFPINSQVPLQRNVNIFLDNPTKTIETLAELARLQGASGVRPYKYILHMNVGSLEYSVPIEFILKIFAELKYRIDHPFPETWQPVTCTVLCKEGNIVLSPALLFAIDKKVCRYKDSVEYRIPVPAGKMRWKIVKYVEPLLKGYNDNCDSMRKTMIGMEKALKESVKSGSGPNAAKFAC